MRGIALQSSIEFPTAFEPLLDQLGGRTWLALPHSFDGAQDWGDDGAYDENTETFTHGPGFDFPNEVQLVQEPHIRFNDAATQYGYCARCDLFPKYASAISNDWSALFGTRKPVPDPMMWLRAYYASDHRSAYLQEHADCVIQCVDAAYWAFHSHDENLVTRLAAYWDRRGWPWRTQGLADTPL
ncbi:hypothetical protein [Tahibacter amnicola]|uniref:Uncharacterized protein n=1 Tax=Tahibacter amnicola TaxID=2976241 RepID=A0ABY6BA03_9GAMM|nr:hypothetical protein [Tahibacter amnicola]UXI66891.1 hypothetical protein N4264_19340 [Tahibacter amnicola]